MAVTGKKKSDGKKAKTKTKAKLKLRVTAKSKLVLKPKPKPKVLIMSKPDDDVNGVVVGRFMFHCTLCYDGRKQAQIRAETEDEARTMARAKKAELIAACGDAAYQIYPHDLWELRIYD